MAEELNLKSIEALLKSFVSRTSKEMRDILKSKGMGKSRLARTGTYFKISKKGNSFTVKSTLPDYAIWTDLGRAPGKMPPLKVIADWCKRKNINTKYAYPIAKKVGKNGLKPTNFTSPMVNLNDLIIKMKEEYSNAVFEQVKLEVQEIRNNYKS